MQGDIEYANRVRARRNEILRELGDGSRSLRGSIYLPLAAICQVSVYHLIETAYKMGPKGARKVLDQANVDPLSPVGQLTPKQRTDIIDALPKRAT
jgi:hypothetical protein